ncbi:MAG: ABC transporter permease [Chloroflexota bacterium]
MMTVEPTSVLVKPKGAKVKFESPRKRTLRRFLRHRLAMVGLVILVTVVVLAIIGSEQAAMQQHLKMGWTNQPPGTTLVDTDKKTGVETTYTFVLGTDGLGRDMLARVLVGGRVSLVVSFFSVLLATSIGLFIGVASGYAGGRADTGLMRVVDIVLSFPVILLLLVVSTLVGGGVPTLILMVGLVTWAGGARIIRGQVLAMRNATYIEAARVIGVPGLRMVRSHVLPNIVAPIVVLATFGVASVIIFEAGLSYLGLGVQPPTPSWGNIVNQARTITVLERYPWQWAPAAFMIVITVLAVNFVGDGLRDAFDQRSTRDR